MSKIEKSIIPMTKYDKVSIHKIDRYDKPYRVQPPIDNFKNNKIFHLILKLDTNELLQYSLKENVPLSSLNDEGECLIHYVIKINDKNVSQEAKINIIKFLVSNNVNPDTYNKYNVTPLHLACSFQYDKISKYLRFFSFNC